MDKLKVYIAVLRTSKAGFFDPETHITLAPVHGQPDAASSSINFHHPQSKSPCSFRVKTKQTGLYNIDLLHADARLRNAVVALEAAVKSKAETLRVEKKEYAERWTWVGAAEEFPSVTLEDPDTDRLWMWEIEEKEI